MPLAAQSGSPMAAPAQRLADGVIARNPDMLDVLMHVTPPGSGRNIVVAAHLRHAVGEASGDDDLGVIDTRHPLVEVQKDGVRIGVLVPLEDRHRKVIGALGLMFPYHAGDDQAALLARAFRIRNRLGASIPNVGALFG